MKRINYLMILMVAVLTLGGCFGGDGGSDAEGGAMIEVEENAPEEGVEENNIGQVSDGAGGEEVEPAATTSEADSADSAPSQGETVSETAAQEAVVTETPTEEPTGSEPSAPVAETKYFNMTLKNWELVPSTITVNTGDTVTLTMTSADMDHGLSIPQFGVSQFVGAGETATVTFVANKAGSYTMFCNVQCGQGHGRMKGTLVVN
ncbi:MAG: cupredoxin domain-containing protein [Gammaproteobacteria bacterium]|nr:cupredoxin domain-containing protein [Gammaproteobacteria bacterium]